MKPVDILKQEPDRSYYSGFAVPPSAHYIDLQSKSLSEVLSVPVWTAGHEHLTVYTTLQPIHLGSLQVKSTVTELQSHVCVLVPAQWGHLF